MSASCHQTDSSDLPRYSPATADRLKKGDPPADPLVTALLFADTGTLRFDNIHWRIEHSRSFFGLADGWLDADEPVRVYEAHLWDTIDRAYRAANQQLRKRRENGQTGLENW